MRASHRAVALLAIGLALLATVAAFGAVQDPRAQTFEERLADQDAVERTPGAGEPEDGAAGAPTLADRLAIYWQGLYLYGVSLLAALWLVARLRRDVTLDRSSRTVQLDEDPRRTDDR